MNDNRSAYDAEAAAEEERDQRRLALYVNIILLTIAVLGASVSIYLVYQIFSAN